MSIVKLGGGAYVCQFDDTVRLVGRCLLGGMVYVVCIAWPPGCMHGPPGGSIGASVWVVGGWCIWGGCCSGGPTAAFP